MTRRLDVPFCAAGKAGRTQQAKWVGPSYMIYRARWQEDASKTIDLSSKSLSDSDQGYVKGVEFELGILHVIATGLLGVIDTCCIARLMTYDCHYASYVALLQNAAENSPREL